MNARKRVTFRLSPKCPASPAQTPPMTARSASRQKPRADALLYEVMIVPNYHYRIAARIHFRFCDRNTPAASP